MFAHYNHARGLFQHETNIIFVTRTPACRGKKTINKDGATYYDIIEHPECTLGLTDLRHQQHYENHINIKR